jgi:hypothetical protein
MNDYLLLMHDDVPAGELDGAGRASWAGYLEKLRASGQFGGGSAIGDGVCASRTNQSKAVTSHLTGYLRVRAASLDEALNLLAGNPVYEAGGTVEVRELPRD